MSVTSYLIILLSILSISIFALVIWFRQYVSPKMTNNIIIVPELPQPVTNGISKPIPIKLEICLGVGAIIVYLVVRFVGLSNFPIYFFTDEAAQTVLAEQLIKSDFRIDDEFLPTYFWNSNKYSLSTSVYLQVLPYMIFGKSVLVTRGTSVLITLVGVLSIGLILKQIFRVQNWWLGIFILSITPAWFLHSRTAFETVIATVFYGSFMYAYLQYLYKSPRFLYLAIFAAALTFYSYNPARLVILVTMGLLLLSDFRYHWQNRRVVGWGLLLVFLLAIPYLRFLVSHINEDWNHLLLMDSYWTKEIEFTQKLSIFGREYSKGLSIVYWYSPQNQDLSRHVMEGYGHFLFIFLPLLLVGLWETIKNWKIPAYRFILITLLCSPVGGALVETFVTRTLMLVMPVTVITTLGVIKSLNFFRALRERQVVASVFLFVVFCFGQLAMTIDVLTNSALWFNDYGLYGLQYGSQQVFASVNDYLLKNPDAEAIVTYKWLNGPTMVMRFFVQEPKKVFLEDWETINKPNSKIKENSLLVITANEWSTVSDLDRQRYKILKMIPYPDQSPGFYFLQLSSN